MWWGNEEKGRKRGSRWKRLKNLRFKSQISYHLLSDQDMTSNTYRSHILSTCSATIIFRVSNFLVWRLWGHILTVINGHLSGGSKCCTFLEKESLIITFFLENAILHSPSISSGTKIFYSSQSSTPKMSIHIFYFLCLTNYCEKAGNISIALLYQELSLDISVCYWLPIRMMTCCMSNKLL